MSCALNFILPCPKAPRKAFKLRHGADAVDVDAVAEQILRDAKERPEKVRQELAAEDARRAAAVRATIHGKG